MWTFLKSFSSKNDKLRSAALLRVEGFSELLIDSSQLLEPLIATHLEIEMKVTMLNNISRFNYESSENRLNGTDLRNEKLVISRKQIIYIFPVCSQPPCKHH